MSGFQNNKFLKLNESFDSNKLAYIINNFASFKNKLRWRKRYDEFEPVNILKKYLNRSRNGQIRVDYKQKNGKGRFFAIGSMSLQNIAREIRHTIARDYYFDIDLTNAHPVILCFLCDKYNFQCEALKEYIENREELLKQVKDDDGKVLSRDKVKQIYLSLTNGGDKDFRDITTPSKHLRKYKKEMLKLHKLFSDKFPEEFKIVSDKRIKQDKNYNNGACFMNSLMCDMENNLLMEMYNFFGKPDNAVLCFDGIMLKKGTDYDIKGCVNHLKKVFDINIDIKIKTMDEHFDMSKCTLVEYKYKSLDYFINYKNLVCKGQDMVYPEHIDEWLKNSVALIVSGGNQFFLTKGKSVDPDNNEEIIMYKPVKIENVYATLKKNCNVFNPYFDYGFWMANKKYPSKVDNFDKIKMKKFSHTKLGAGTTSNPGFLNDHMQNDEVETFDRSEFYPYLARKGKPKLYECFNTFTGFPLEKITANYDDIKFEDTLIYNHLKVIMFNSDPGELNHFLDHLADIIQDPANIKPNAHLFHSKQGTGKGVMAEWFKRLIGINNATTIINLERYFDSSFNIHQCSKILKIFEEVKSKGKAYNQSNRLKAEISSRTENIEPKGIDSWSVRNCARMWFFTNNENSLYIEGDDRRYTLHKVNNSKADDPDYFEPLLKEISDIRYLKCAFEFLAERKYTDKSVRRYYPTKYKTEQKLSNLPNGIKFIKSYIESKFTEKDLKIEISKKNMTKIPASYIKTKYKSWCEDNGSKYNMQTLKTQLKKIDIGEPRRLRFEGGKGCLCYLIHPKDIENKIQNHLKDKTFKFDFGEHIEGSLSFDTESDSDSN